MSEIGRQRRIEDVERVIYVLGTCEPRAPLAIAAIWALGELGGEASQRALLKWAGSPVIECRFEALESLARLRCSEALPLFLEIVGRPRAERSPIGWEASERQACWEHLVAFGDPTCIPELTEMVAPFPDREWGLALDAPYGAALNPYAALAACGDSSALAALHDFLIIEVQNMVRDPIFPSSRGGSINGFPGCYLLGQCVLYPERCLENIRIAAAIRILEPRSELRDAFLRNVARDPRTPDGGTIYLLSRLASPNSLDIELLLDIARRAIGPGAIHIECAVSQRGGSENTRVSYNAHACGVAYAFAQLKSVEGLLRLWDECPRYDLALRAEIAYAFARLGAAEGIQPVLEYTEAAWNERVASLEYRDAVSARLASDSRGGPSEDLLDLDVRYRQQEIVRFLRGRKSNRDVMLHLVTSKRIHPLMRLRWIGESTRMQGLWPWFGDDALDALSAIERASTDHVVVALAAAVRRDIDRYRAFASDWERRLQ
ncbi:MAG: HEAT repeat domain-containing protein [bacterium]